MLWVADLLSLLPYTNAWPNRATTGLYLGTYVMIVMLTIIGGRVVPNFTRGALRAQGLEQGVTTSDDRLEGGHCGRGLSPSQSIWSFEIGRAHRWVVVNGCAALLAAGLLSLRAKGWRFRETWDNPLLWILHVGQGWLIVAFAARAVSSLTGWLPPTAAFHAMGAGAMATMIFAFLTRAPLGHTGRPLRASRVTTLAYLLVIGAGVARVASPLLSGSLQLVGPHCGGQPLCGRLCDLCLRVFPDSDPFHAFAEARERAQSEAGRAPCAQRTVRPQCGSMCTVTSFTENFSLIARSISSAMAWESAVERLGSTLTTSSMAGPDPPSRERTRRVS